VKQGDDSPIGFRVAGLLTRGSQDFGGLPGFPVAKNAGLLTAYSCGGSHGVGPDWVVLTVFPVRPSAFRLRTPHGGCCDRSRAGSSTASSRFAVRKRHDRRTGIKHLAIDFAATGNPVLTLFSQ
jgi:hypothetical protein